MLPFTTGPIKLFARKASGSSLLLAKKKKLLEDFAVWGKKKV